MITVGALCAGYGGIELGLSMLVDTDLKWMSEINEHASMVLDARFPEVPNLGDLTTIVDPPQVDIVTAGFPCQPVSLAGRQKGHDDERWLIYDVLRIAEEAQAEVLILENVLGIYTTNEGEAFRQVVLGLAERGWVAEWGRYRASSVGAPHRRQRWFCVARHADRLVGAIPGELGSSLRFGHFGDGEGGDPGHRQADANSSSVGWVEGPGSRSSEAGGERGHGSHHDGGTPVADSDQSGLEGSEPAQRRQLPPGGDRQVVADSDGEFAERRGGPSTVAGPQGVSRDEDRQGAHSSGDSAQHRSAVAANSNGERFEGVSTGDRSDEGLEVERGHDPDGRGMDHSRGWGDYEGAIVRWEHLLGRPAPNPLANDRLNPVFVEWMMGLPEGWVTDLIERRTQSLKILGNGVVPQQAAAAIKGLSKRLTDVTIVQDTLFP